MSAHPFDFKGCTVFVAGGSSGINLGIADAYRSREFLAITETRFAGFVKTDYQQALQAAAAK